MPALYEQLGDELNIPIEDNIIRKLQRQPEYKSDYVHFNAAEYQVMAENIKAFLHKHEAF